MATGVDTKAEGVSSRLRNLRIGAHLWNADAAQKYLGRSVDQAMITMSWAKDGEDFSNLSEFRSAASSLGDGAAIYVDVGFNRQNDDSMKSLGSDPIVLQWADAIGESGRTVYVAVAPEMNGFNGWRRMEHKADHISDPRTFTDAFARVAQAFADRGVTNVKWVFAPTSDGQKISDFYPFDVNIDVIDLRGGRGDNYSSYGQHHMEDDRTFDAQFSNAYGVAKVLALRSGAPEKIWITDICQRDCANAMHAAADSLGNYGAVETINFPSMGTFDYKARRALRSLFSGISTEPDRAVNVRARLVDQNGLAIQGWGVWPEGSAIGMDTNGAGIFYLNDVEPGDQRYSVRNINSGGAFQKITLTIPSADRADPEVTPWIDIGDVIVRK